MTQHLFTALRMTIVTTILLGLVYPLVVTGLAQVFFPDQANGQLVERDGRIVGSRIIGQPFTSRGYFYSRPSGAGTGYDGALSSGSNLGPTNKKLLDRVSTDVERLRKDAPGAAVPIDLVTASGSGVDPHVSPAAALYQLPRVARERGLEEADVRELVDRYTEGRQFGILGEPVVNVLMVNLALDERAPNRP